MVIILVSTLNITANYRVKMMMVVVTIKVHASELACIRLTTLCRTLENPVIRVAPESMCPWT